VPWRPALEQQLGRHAIMASPLATELGLSAGDLGLFA
jgi:hypothetical protein